MKGLTISRLAKAANVHVETVKYYERRGLLSKPDRNDSGYRIFLETAVEDLKLIKKAQEIGFTLNEIHHLIAIVKQKDYYPTEDMYAFATAKVNEINEKITRLGAFKALLEQVTTQPAHSLPQLKQDCPVLKTFWKG